MRSSWLSMKYFPLTIPAANLTLRFMNPQVPGKELISVHLSELPATPFTLREQIRSVLVKFGRGFLHDLNNPVGALSGYVDMLNDLKKRAEQSDSKIELERLATCIEGLQQCVTRLAELMNEARSSLRPEAAALRLFSPADLGETLTGLDDDQFRFYIVDTEGFSSHHNDFTGYPRFLSQGIRNMATEVARCLGSGHAVLRARRINGMDLSEEVSDQLPSDLGMKDLLEINITIPGGTLTSEEMERMYYPLNLRSPAVTSKGGWNFAGGYAAIRAHGGGAALTAAKDALVLGIFLPFSKKVSPT